MIEALNESIAAPNLPFTILLGAVIVYWALVGIGLLDMEHGSHGADLDVDADVDGALEHAGTLSSVLHFMNVGQVPVMIVASVLVLAAWIISMISNHYLGGGSLGMALALLIPNLALSVLITRYATKPFKAFFHALNRNADEHKPIVGSTCVVVSGEVNEAFGQAEVATGGAPFLINARAADGAVLKKGETGLVIKQEKDFFLIIKATPDKLEA